jgi:transposase
MLDYVEAQEAEIAALDERIEAALAPFVGQVELLTTIPGVDHRSAQVILAEIGPDIDAAYRKSPVLLIERHFR